MSIKPRYNFERLEKHLPFVIDLRCVSFAFSIVDNANKLVKALLHGEPWGEAMRELIIDLREFENNTIAGFRVSETAGEIAQDLLESKFDRAEVHDGMLTMWDKDSPTPSDEPVGDPSEHRI